MGSEPVSFYFDLASPLAYLAAERVGHVLGGRAVWEPVLARDLEAGERFESFRCGSERDLFRDEVARRARELGLQPIRWPEEFPFDSGLAMRVATYARSIGRPIAFAQAAFRQAFAGGRSLEEADNVVIAAAACEMHPAAVLAAAKLRSTERELRGCTSRAAHAGVREVPAVVIGDPQGDHLLFHGERSIEQAAAHLERAIGANAKQAADAAHASPPAMTAAEPG